MKLKSFFYTYSNILYTTLFPEKQKYFHSFEIEYNKTFYNIQPRANKFGELLTSSRLIWATSGVSIVGSYTPPH